jgi:hypothetical protein
MLLLAPFLLTDIILYFRKKISGKFIFSYLLAGALFLPIVFFWIVNENDLLSFWPAVPNLEIFKWVVYGLLDNDKLIMTLYLAGLAVLLSKLMAKDITVDDIPIIICSGIPPFMFGVIFVYSKYINPGGSLFVDRYFICVIPAVIIMCSYCFEKLYTAVINNTMQSPKTRIAMPMLLLVFMLRFPSFLTDFRADPEYLYEPLKSGTYWLRSQNDIYLDTTAVVVSTFEHYNMTTGWTEYYVKKTGRRSADADVFNIVHEPDIKYEKIYYFVPNAGVSRREHIEYLENYYKNTQELKHLGISVYERKEG